MQPAVWVFPLLACNVPCQSQHEVRAWLRARLGAVDDARGGVELLDGWMGGPSLAPGEPQTLKAVRASKQEVRSARRCSSLEGQGAMQGIPGMPKRFDGTLGGFGKSESCKTRRCCSIWESSRPTLTCIFLHASQT